MTALPTGRFDDEMHHYKLAYEDILYSQLAYTLTEGTPNLITALGAGPPAISHAGIAASELAGLHFDTADEAYGFWPFPWYMDKTRDVHAQLFFEVEEAAKSAIDWALWLKGLAIGELSSDAKVDSDGNVAFDAAANTSAGEWVATERKALKLADALEDDIGAMFAVELDDLGDATANKVRLMVVRFYFTAQFADQGGIRQGT